jgi:N-acetylmuramoyl-L-alanine amidase
MPRRESRSQGQPQNPGQSRASGVTRIPGTNPRLAPLASLVMALVTIGGCGSIGSTPQQTAASPTVSTTLEVQRSVSPTRPVPAKAGAPVIVIDPGHSGRSIQRVDPKTGLHDIDYPNYPEIYEMFDVSTCAAQALRSMGYRVLLTKAHTLSSVSHAARAGVANRSHADLAISVHDDHGAPARFQATYDQRGLRDKRGKYGEMYRGRGSARTVYRRPSVARKGQQAARTIAAARTVTQRRPVSVEENNYGGRAPLEPGNLALVQLFSTVPWVYNEMGALTGGAPSRAMSITSERRYAQGLMQGVAAAVPLVPARAGTATYSAETSARSLTTCLRKRVEPEPGTYTRPRKYLPNHF